MLLAGDADHADGIAVFFTEQGHGAHVDGGLLIHQARGHGIVGHDGPVHVMLYGGQFFRRQGRDVGEVETQTVRGNQ